MPNQVADLPRYGQNVRPRTRIGCLGGCRKIRAWKLPCRVASYRPQVDGGLPVRIRRGAGLLPGATVPTHPRSYLQITMALEVNARAENVAGTALGTRFRCNAAKMSRYELTFTRNNPLF